jgi:hypothetical protein
MRVLFMLHNSSTDLHAFTKTLTDLLFHRDLSKRLPFVDKDNMAVFGWGYGGFITAHILALDEDKIDENEKNEKNRKIQHLFRCGIAISPIAKFEFHGKVLSFQTLSL